MSVQVVLSSSSKLEGLIPELTDIIDPNGTKISGNAVQLYRVGYINITQPSDPAGGTGEWPDALYPIGIDRYYGEPRNGAPFNLEAGHNQPIWIEIRIPRDASAGVYAATFRVVQGGTVIAQLPLQLTVWNITLPEKPTLPTTYKLNTHGTYCYHYYYQSLVCGEEDYDRRIKELTNLYLHEAAAHCITLNAPIDASISYQFDAATQQVIVSDWTSWDKALKPEMTSYPLPGPNFLWSDANSYPWTEAQTQEAIAFWRAVAQHYREKGWLERSFLYTFDEPLNPWPKTQGSSDGEKISKQLQLVAHQSNVLHQADPALRSLVTSSYNDYLATNGQIDIWVPVVNSLDNNGGFSTVYELEKAKGKKVWWYDSNNSGLADRCKVDDPSDQENRCEEPSDYGNWPDVFIDHQGVNQLVYGPLTWKYRLEGYLYYGTNENYQGSNNVWQQNYFLGRNGDGTLFYPGRPSDIGGTTHIPVSSIRLQILRQSWAMYDFLVMLRDRGKENRADEIVNTLVTSSDTWSHDANAYDRTRDLLAVELTT